MKQLNEIELAKVNGGISAAAIFGGIAIAIAFIASAIYGYFYPKEG